VSKNEDERVTFWYVATFVLTVLSGVFGWLLRAAVE